MEDLNIQYRDARGNRLEEIPDREYGQPLHGKPRPVILVPSGATATFQTSNFGPPGTVSVVAVLQAVTFADATEWRAAIIR